MLRVVESEADSRSSSHLNWLYPLLNGLYPSYTSILFYEVGGRSARRREPWQAPAKPVCLLERLQIRRHHDHSKNDYREDHCSKSCECIELYGPKTAAGKGPLALMPRRMACGLTDWCSILRKREDYEQLMTGLRTIAMEGRVLRRHNSLNRDFFQIMAALLALDGEGEEH